MSKDDLNPRNLEVHILKEYTWDRAKWGEHKQPQEEVNGQKQDWITKFLASTLVIDSKFTEYNCALFDNDQLLRYECHDPSLPWFTMFIWDDYEAHERFVARVRGDGIQPKANPASRSALRAVRECEIVCE